ncbi:MAG: insulinase family protein, partial [Treponema sp.]|nr:insulinase family protein [Treponema sp.]
PHLMRPYVETYLASIPPREENWNTWTDHGITRPGRVEEHVFTGLEEQSVVVMSWFAPAVFTEQLNMAAWVLGEYLNIRLNDEIRENLGGVYSIWAWLSVSSIPRGEMALRVEFACDPRRVEELSEAVVQLLNETVLSVVQDIFNNAVEAQLQSWELFMQNNASIAGSYINSAVSLNLPLARLHRRPQYINAVTPADVQDITTRLLQSGPAKIVRFSALHNPSL